jgi:hypothetical protein
MTDTPAIRPSQARSITSDAHEFGLHMRQGGWRLGLLVARNVVVAPGRVAPETLLPKVNATAFAKIAGTSNDRVLRHLAAWERAAKAGLVPHAASLTPGSDIDLDVEHLPAWTPIYNAPIARTPPAPRTRRAPEPVTTRRADPIVPPPAAPLVPEIVDTTDAQVSSALESARMTSEAALAELRAQDAQREPQDRASARSAEWTEDVRYAINAMLGHTRRLIDAARDPEWTDIVGRRRAALDMYAMAKQLGLIAEMAVSEDRGPVTDEALAALIDN